MLSSHSADQRLFSSVDTWQLAFPLVTVVTILIDRSLSHMGWRYRQGGFPLSHWIR